MDIQMTDILPYLASVITGVVGWFTGKRKQRNDFLSELQASIDMLSEKNKQLLEEVLHLREENIKVHTEVAMLREENAALLAEIEELNRKLTNVKTITRKG